MEGGGLGEKRRMGEMRWRDTVERPQVRRRRGAATPAARTRMSKTKRKKERANSHLDRESRFGKN